ncbi:hypothetical protein BU23DRAFT_561655 [Bimuria novae-zelandiae CBS 107.79]|uniref:Uncharacterized protein n=1 Tax=Bimuria novae-zelandiae CBS 107.79 TaxID=1447943 RepID=A0A6A5UHT1_9PLEO|nr:hypothetical protein BU23DRAFT_561655 [Bimuria novae-zelandiae CBS 107.79]
MDVFVGLMARTSLRLFDLLLPIVVALLNASAMFSASCARSWLCLRIASWFIHAAQ